MKKLFLLAASVALVACAENPTQPVAKANLAPHLIGPNLTVLTPGGADLLVCFDGTTQGGFGGVCTASLDHKKATLNNNSSNPAGDYAGVYSFDPTVYGQFLTDITALSYTYKSTTNPQSVPTLGDLSYNIPIDMNGDGTADFTAFVDAANCGVKPSATVNIVTAAKCGIVDGSPRLHPTAYVNWAAFIADYPGAKIALSDANTAIFIIAERTPSEPSATWAISNVTFGKTGLICFDGTTDGGFGGVCSLGKDFKSGTLSNNSGLPSGDYSGVYSRELQEYGLFLSNIHDLTYRYKGPVPTLGDLSYNIPIDLDGNGSTDVIAFVDAANCRGKLGGNSVYTVDITKDLACGIVVGSPSPSPFYANWAAFAAANPIARIANDNQVLFMVAERTPSESSAVWSILSVDWGKPGH